MKYYFCDQYDGGERCYPISFYRAEMLEYDMRELELIEAKLETGTGHFYCQEFQEVGEVGEGCGKICDKYAPRNGKNGRCRHSSNCYVKTDKRQILKIKP